jgi:periplasmic copper chaperone A
MKRMKGSVAVATLVAAAFLGLSGCGGEPSAASAPSAIPTTSSTTGASATAGSLELTGFWAKQSSLEMSAVYGHVENTGKTADALVKAAAKDVPEVELHQENGTAMDQVDSFPIPAGGHLDLSPGGNHIMLVGLSSPLVPGDKVELTVTFQSGATATMTMPVEEFTSADGDPDTH